MDSVVVTFEAREFAAGVVTAASPGCAVRMTIADEILDDGLDVQYEILGGTPSDREIIIEESRRLFDATFKVTQDRPSAWRAVACLRDVAALHQHPIYIEALAARRSSERIVIVYETGLAIMRVDFHNGEADIWATRLEAALKMTGRAGMVRKVSNLGGTLEEWRPMPQFGLP